MDDKLLIGQTIKEKRKRKNMTQFMLAEKVGMHEKQISRIEAGVCIPSLMSFLKIIDILDLKMSDFSQNSIPPKNNLKDNISNILNNADDIELKMYLDACLRIIGRKVKPLNL